MLQGDRIRHKLETKGTDAPSLPDALLLVEHPTVYTLGSSSSMADILFPLDEDSVGRVGDSVRVQDPAGGGEFEVHRVQRGGKVTYHCPGQLVGYPIIDLGRHEMDIGWYLRQIEELLIDVLAEFGIEAGVIEGLTGVWIDGAKVAAIGVGASRWVTMHGFALNVDPTCELAGFRRIVPCGIDDRPVCSMRQVLGDACPPTEDVRRVTKELFALRFGMEMREMDGSPEL